MSFSNFNNSYPQGSQLQNCSAGSPIGGVDSNNIFRLLHLSASGGLLTQSFVPISYANYVVNNPIPGSSGSPGLKAAGVTLAYLPILTIINPGTYAIRPIFFQDQNTGGAVNMMLIRGGSAMAVYMSSIVIGTDAFTPSIVDFNDGVAAIWHNVVMQDIGTGSTSVALNTTNNVDNMTQSAYLEGGIYRLLVFVHTAITTGPTSTNYSGVQFINQIA